MTGLINRYRLLPEYLQRPCKEIYNVQVWPRSRVCWSLALWFADRHIFIIHVMIQSGCVGKFFFAACTYITFLTLKDFNIVYTEMYIINILIIHIE